MYPSQLDEKSFECFPVEPPPVQLKGDGGGEMGHPQTPKKEKGVVIGSLTSLQEDRGVMGSGFSEICCCRLITKSSMHTHDLPAQVLRL